MCDSLQFVDYVTVFFFVSGGAAITCKNDLEKINEENVEIVSSQLREAMITGSSSRKVLGMDWSKRPGKSGISCDADDFEDQNLDSSSFVVVHGAGYFHSYFLNQH